MKHNEFRIGSMFSCGGNLWQCTDIGTRTILAVRLGYKDESWYAGPPYHVAEHPFDEYDIEGCEYISGEDKEFEPCHYCKRHRTEMYAIKTPEGMREYVCNEHLTLAQGIVKWRWFRNRIERSFLWAMISYFVFERGWEPLKKRAKRLFGKPCEND